MLVGSRNMKRVIIAILLFTLAVYLFYIFIWQEPVWQSNHWKANTINKVESIFRYINTNIGAFAELPPLPIQDTPDLYTTVWTIKTLSLIDDITRKDRSMQAIVKWIQSLQKEDGMFYYPNNPGFPDLYVTYLAVKGLDALGEKPTNKNALSVALKNFQDGNGLFVWDKNTAPDYTATELACEILSTIGVTDHTKAARRALLVAFTNDKLFKEADVAQFLNNGAPIINSMHVLGVNSTAFPKELIEKRLRWLNTIEEEFFKHADTSGQSLSTLEALIKAKRFFGTSVAQNDAYIRMLMENQLRNGGYPAMDGDHMMDPQATFKVAQVLAHWNLEFSHKEALLNTLEVGRKHEGWIRQVSARPDPKSTYYALNILDSLHAKPIHATEIDLSIKDWIKAFLERSKDTSLSEQEQLLNLEAIYYTIKCAELRKIAVDEKKIKDTLDGLVKISMWNHSETPISVILHFAELYQEYQGNLPREFKIQSEKRAFDILNNKQEDKADFSPAAILNAIKLLQILGKLDDKVLDAALRQIQLFSMDSGSFKTKIKAGIADVVATYYALEIYAMSDVQANDKSLKKFLNSVVHPSGGFCLYPRGEVESNDLTLETTYMGIKLVEKLRKGRTDGTSVQGLR